MVRFILILAAAVCLGLKSNAAEEKPGPDALVVNVLRAPLPSEETKKEEFLWDNCARTPDAKKFSSYGTEKWKDNFKRFAAALRKRADEQKLDSLSLSKALDLIVKDSNDQIAYLPIGAYQTTLDRKLVWIIAVKWESLSMAEVVKGVNLGHIRAFVFEQKTLKRVGFITCM